MNKVHNRKTYSMQSSYYLVLVFTDTFRVLRYNEPHHPGGHVLREDVNWNFGVEAGDAVVVGTNGEGDDRVDFGVTIGQIFNRNNKVSNQIRFIRF